MADNQHSKYINAQKPNGRLWLGAAILVLGFLSPLLIPLVISSDWTAGTKSVITGLLAFGIPEVFMILAG